MIIFQTVCTHLTQSNMQYSQLKIEIAVQFICAVLLMFVLLKLQLEKGGCQASLSVTDNHAKLKVFRCVKATRPVCSVACLPSECAASVPAALCGVCTVQSHLVPETEVAGLHACMQRADTLPITRVPAFSLNHSHQILRSINI